MYQDEYLETQVMTASPQKLHLMVVDAAIRFAHQGREALEVKDFEVSHEALSRSRQFVSEMICGLNKDRAPEMVDTLDKMFSYVYSQIALGDITHDVAPIDRVIKVLQSHRETWLEVLELAIDSPTPEATSQNWLG